MEVLKLSIYDNVPTGYTGIVEYSDGTRHWYKCGQLHREDGPACEYIDGSREWFIEDRHHRVDGPAVEEAGEVRWYLDGKLHRVGGPAIEYSNGTCYWYKCGDRHRLDGPALEFAGGGVAYYIEDEIVEESEYLEAVLLYKCKQVFPKGLES
jgi:hypothetical protein